MLPVGELTDEDLAIQRYLLDLVLQPLDRWDGFDQIEQLGGSALRYQLNSISYALALAQFNFTPAFAGYIAEAQRNAILKMADRKVWGYWAIENLMGYGRWEPDPIVWNNVMYTAYLGVMIGLYETLNDDAVFSQPDAFSLRWNQRLNYSYHFASIAEAIRRNMRKRPGCPQYPCEPHLIYPLCNTFAFNTLLMHDRLHRTDMTGDLVERVRESYGRDGWIRPDGRFVAGRLEKFKLPILPASVAYDAAMTYWLHAAMPDVARSTWEMLSHRFLQEANGRLTMKGRWWDKMDVGNYKRARGYTFTYAMLAHTAREMGDEHSALIVEHEVEQLNEVMRQHGARRFAGVSVMGNGIYAMARFGRASSMHDLILGNVPDAWKQGPRLGQVAYPDVLVARAVTDGKKLQLILKPGRGPVRTTLAIERLLPLQSYRVTGASVDRLVADIEGHALLEVILEGRTEVFLGPISPPQACESSC